MAHLTLPYSLPGRHACRPQVELEIVGGAAQRPGSSPFRPAYDSQACCPLRLPALPPQNLVTPLSAQRRIASLARQMGDEEGDEAAPAAVRAAAAAASPSAESGRTEPAGDQHNPRGAGPTPGQQTVRLSDASTQVNPSQAHTVRVSNASTLPPGFNPSQGGQTIRLSNASTLQRPDDDGDETTDDEGGGTQLVTEITQPMSAGTVSQTGSQARAGLGKRPASLSDLLPTGTACGQKPTHAAVAIA